MAIQNGEDVAEFRFNLFCANSLNFNFYEVPLIRNNNGINVIVGNPPYIRVQNMVHFSENEYEYYMLVRQKLISKVSI